MDVEVTLTPPCLFHSRLRFSMWNTGRRQSDFNVDSTVDGTKALIFSRLHEGCMAVLKARGSRDPPGCASSSSSWAKGRRSARQSSWSRTWPPWTRRVTVNTPHSAPYFRRHHFEISIMRRGREDPSPAGRSALYIGRPRMEQRAALERMAVPPPWLRTWPTRHCSCSPAAIAHWRLEARPGYINPYKPL
jgi:hypothetical protein